MRRRRETLRTEIVPEIKIKTKTNFSKLSFQSFFREMAEKQDCECVTKWAYLQFALEKDENGKTLLERCRLEANPQQSVANEVLILCLVFQISKNSNQSCDNQISAVASSNSINFGAKVVSKQDFNEKAKSNFR